MTELIVTVGLPCSGKSTWAKEFKEKEGVGNYIIIESDEYRTHLFGNKQDKETNTKLFEIIHGDIYQALSVGRNVILDATNLSQKHRKTLLQKIAKLNVHKTCVLFATSYDICLERNEKRERKVPIEIIKRMRENFNVPMYNEGFDNIEIIYSYNNAEYNISDFLNMADEFDQKNVNHTMTLGYHSTAVANYMLENKVDDHIYLAALLHDVAKPLTQVFTTFKGEPTEDAHYFSHDNCGAYESLFYLNEHCHRTKDILFASALINYHMRLYFSKSDKSKKKLLNTVGEDMYYFLKLLHEADKTCK